MGVLLSIQIPWKISHKTDSCSGFSSFGKACDFTPTPLYGYKMEWPYVLYKHPKHVGLGSIFSFMINNANM